MESELDLLLGTAIDSLVKLEILLDLHARPGSAQTPDQIGSRLRRPREEVARALEQLSEAGLIDRFALGTGKHVIYGPAEDPHVGQLLELLHERYHGDPEARTRIVRRTAEGRANLDPETGPSDG